MFNSNNFDMPLKYGFTLGGLAITIYEDAAKDLAITQTIPNTDGKINTPDDVVNHIVNTVANGLFGYLGMVLPGADECKTMIDIIISRIKIDQEKDLGIIWQGENISNKIIEGIEELKNDSRLKPTTEG